MFQSFSVNIPTIPEKEFDLRAYGAIGDGRTSNTDAFRKAIEAAAEEGGKVIVPNGIWLTGPILFDKNPEEYPLVVTDFEGITRIRTKSPIYAENAENIAITGHGIINGNGHLWRPVKEFKMTARQWKELLGKSPYVIESKEGGIWFPARNMFDTAITGEIHPGDYDTFEEALAAASPHYDFYRPVMVSLRHCRNILIEDVTLQDSPAWNVHPYFCEHLTVRGVRIINPAYAKSGKDREARKLLKPCEDVYIHDCKVGMSHGGFVIGSEMSRGVRNVLVKDCTFIDSDVGIRFKSAMGRGGVVEDIYLENILMIGIKKESLTMTMNYVLNTVSGDHPVVQSTDPQDIPTFRNIELKNCICRDEDAYYVIQPMSGYPETIQDIRIIDCELGVKK